MQKKQQLIIIVTTLFLFSCGNTISWEDLNKNGKMDMYENTSQSINNRVDDLVKRMSLNEKISQLQDYSPGIEHLGVKPYLWRNEALHGVKANTGPLGERCDTCINQTTVFPQSIGLASTWNPELVHKEATAISDEARALANKIDNYRYLNFWDPMINIARDPRWGRTQEGYGEDPFLVSQMAVQYIKGLQGNDEKYVKVIASPKHFVANNVDGDRHFTSSNIDEKILRDYYFPAFKASITEGNAKGLMSAYNALNDVPCSSNDFLLNRVLRGEWGFDGHVVSDCGAIYNIHANHFYTSTEEKAVAKALKSGTDMNCGGEYGKYLSDSIESGLISEEEINVNLKRILRSRFLLGDFDPQHMVPYAKISEDVIDSENHRHLAKQVALESIVLLKNDDNLLPITKEVESIAVIGPNADTAHFGNYSGLPSYKVSPLDGIKTKLGSQASVKYAQGAPIYQKDPLPVLSGEHLISPSGEKGLMAEFFNNMKFQGEPVLVRLDTLMQHHWWDEGQFPDSIVNNDNFSVRWTGKIIPKESGRYFFNARTTVRSSKEDIGMRIYVDDKLIVDQWTSLRHWDTGLTKRLVAGKSYDFKVEYVEDIDWAEVTIGWRVVKDNLIKDAVKLAKESELVIMVVGSNNALEEELHDRGSISLLPSQQRLIKSVHEVNKNIILVLINGSPISLKWEKDNIPAILEAWYPGQEGGNAIADIIFGDYSPNGKLPITFYEDDDQLIDFYDYDITKGRTYMYLEDQPLYPFGFGLSYTTFELNNFKLNGNKFQVKDTIVVTFDIKNTGDMEGAEVVQLYVRPDVLSKYVPNKQLKSFEKVFLKHGERRRVQLTIPVHRLASFNSVLKKDVVEKCNYDIMVGNSSESILYNDTFTIND